MLAGVPAALYDAVDSIVKTASNPQETYDALKSLFNSGDVLGNVSDAVKQSYVDRIDQMETEYQKAGASGSFKAGVEGGKLVTDIASLLAGGAGVVKGGAVLTEKVVAKAISSMEKAATKSLFNQMKNQGIKFTPENVVSVAKDNNGKVIFLEKGNSKAGLQHIIEQHGDQFSQIGVSEASIPNVVMKAVTDGKIIGYQGVGQGRPIYETTINGKKYNVAVTVGNNGYIVGANLRGAAK